MFQHLQETIDDWVPADLKEPGSGDKPVMCEVDQVSYIITAYILVQAKDFPPNSDTKLQRSAYIGSDVKMHTCTASKLWEATMTSQ